jgi:uncharacterized membrane protein YtjA (UPF0391 family)
MRYTSPAQPAGGVPAAQAWLVTSRLVSMSHERRTETARPSEFVAIYDWHGFCFVRSRSAFARNLGGLVMLYWAAVFFVIALLAAVFGFGGIAASAAGVAKILFIVFLILAVVSLIFGRRVPT